MAYMLPSVIVARIMLPVFIELFARYVLRDRIREHETLSIIYARFHKYFPYLVIVTCMLVISVIESSIFDMYLWNVLGTDFTPWIYSIEGNAVENIQSAMWNPHLTNYFAFMYMVMYAFTFYFSLFVYIYLDNEKVIRMLVIGYIFIYALALPFYLFFPVNEVWVTNDTYVRYNTSQNIPLYGYGATRGVLYDLSPGTGDALYVMSSINNCFPSLHTAISFLVPLVMFYNKRMHYFLVTLWISISIIIATMYLGIHWITDIVAGIIVAFVALYLAANFSFKVSYPIKIRDIRWKGKRWKGLL